MIFLIESENLERLGVALPSDVPPIENFEDFYGVTAFERAIQTGNLELVQLVAERIHVDIAFISRLGVTALVTALGEHQNARHGDSRFDNIIVFLYSLGAFTDVAEDSVEYAMRYNLPRFHRHLLDERGLIIHEPDAQQQALFDALLENTDDEAADRDAQVLAALEPLRGSLNFYEEHGFTPLQLAVFRGFNTETIDALIGAGAEVDMFTAEGDSLIDLAWQNGDEALFLHLLRIGAPRDNRALALVRAGRTTGLLAYAVARDMNNLVRVLVEEGADVNQALDVEGARALIFFAQRGNLQMVQYLLEHGANVAATDHRLRTALVVAREAGHVDIVNFLEPLATAAFATPFDDEVTTITMTAGEALEIFDWEDLAALDILPHFLPPDEEVVFQIGDGRQHGSIWDD